MSEQAILSDAAKRLKRGPGAGVGPPGRGHERGPTTCVSPLKLKQHHLTVLQVGRPALHPWPHVNHGAGRVTSSSHDTSSCGRPTPAGYGLARRALALGIELGVCAPGKTERPPADRVKTDKRDAVRLARLLAAGELTLVTIPSVEREQLRDLGARRTY